jgi:hypothetical protein
MKSISRSRTSNSNLAMCWLIQVWVAEQDALRNWVVTPCMRQSKLFNEVSSDKLSRDLLVLNRELWRLIRGFLTGSCKFRWRLQLWAPRIVPYPGNVGRWRNPATVYFANAHTCLGTEWGPSDPRAWSRQISVRPPSNGLLLFWSALVKTWAHNEPSSGLSASGDLSPC